jgi:1-acyl-sn-glycerol-3-phosphate acyltransferase
MGYRIVRWLARALLGLFYHRIEVVGLDHVPARGPLIVAANHHNALVDPMLLLATVPRRLVTLAKASLFSHPLIGPFLRAVGALPVRRRQDGSTDPARNAGLFGAVTRTLRGGGGILIFPEGVTQPEPVLMTVRTGTARMLLEAEATGSGRAGITLLPVGLVFHEPGTFRAGRALVLIGPPVPTADCVALHATGPEAAVRRLTDRLAAALSRQFVEADDRSTLGLLRVVAAVWRAEHPGALESEPARVAWMQQAMAAFRRLRAGDPEQAAALRGRVEAYARDLERAGLAGAEPVGAYPARVVAWYALREGGTLLLGLPLALVGMVLHALPYRLTGAVVRRIGRTAEEEATDKIAVGLVLYPVCWLAEGWLAARLGGGWALAGFAVALLPAGFLALAWRERVDRVRRDARAFLRFLAAPDLAARLLARRRALVDELAALAAPPGGGVRV